MRFLVLGLIVASIPPGLHAQTADEKKTTISYLQSLQTKAGGFRISEKADSPSLRATSSCLRALRYFGGQPRDPEAAKSFVLSCWNRDAGGFADSPGGKPDVILTSVGLMALVELKLPTDKYESPAIRFMTENAREFEQIRMTAAGLESIKRASPNNADWLSALVKKQNRDGTFGSGKEIPRETGSVVACILRLGGKIKDARSIIRALDAGQREDGGFGKSDAAGSDLETSYRIVRTYVMLKARPARSDDLRAFIVKCRNTDGGYGVTPGTPSTASATYFASILLHWLDHS